MATHEEINPDVGTAEQVTKVRYTAKTHSAGGRRGGVSRSDDGRLEVQFSVPGIPGTGTNPEQLSAAGWSDCFISAMGPPRLRTSGRRSFSSASYCRKAS
jgi:lipoyl-dependent peroxiredoxin